MSHESGSLVDSVFVYGPGVWGPVLSTVILLITVSIMALEAVKFQRETSEKYITSKGNATAE
jgi:hypothetical protein